MASAQITNVHNAKVFMFAGKAVFRVISKKSGKTYFFKVKGDGKKLLGSYSVYIGYDEYHSGGTPRYQKVGEVTGNTNACLFKVLDKLSETKPAIAFHWTYSVLVEQRGDLFKQIEFWHSGRCGKCGRPLTSEESKKIGLGPVCYEEVLQEID